MSTGTEPVEPSPAELVKAFARAIAVGDRQEAAKIAKSGTLPGDRHLHCYDEATALWVLGEFATLEASKLTCNAPTIELANAFIANQAIDIEDVAAHMPRMSSEGLLALVGACRKVNGRLSHHAASRLIDLGVKHSRLEVVRALEKRGEKISKKFLSPTPEQSTEMRRHLYEKRSPMSDTEFFKEPFAEGFQGRLHSSFFGLTLGQPCPKRYRCPGVRPHKDRRGNVEGVTFEVYDIPGDAFGAISAELDERFGARRIDEPEHRCWEGQGLEATLRQEMTDAGLLLSLVVKGTNPSASTKAVPLDEMSAAFAETFPELESVDVKFDGKKFSFSADKKGRDAGICVTWPESPYARDRGFSTQFIDAVVADLRDSENVWDDDDYDC